jgi:large subunit ribosomal protein L28
MVGHTISHAHNMTKRRWLPNVQKINVELNGEVRRVYVCASCIQKGKVRKVV